MNFILEQSNDILVTPSGLAIVGQLIAQTALKSRLNQSSIPGSIEPHIKHHEMVAAFLGLLCHGKNDFEDIEEFRDNDFFRMALDIEHVPSCSILRQRFDLAGDQWNVIIKEEIASLLKQVEAVVTPSIRDLVCLDIDVSPFDNSKTKKEGVGRTYKQFDGYAPIFSYLGQEGYCVNLELRPGKTHCQKGTPEFLTDSIRYARKITEAPLLVRMDSGNDSQDNLKICLADDTKADFIIKRNLRRENPLDWLELAQQTGICCMEREGKKVYMGDTYLDISGIENPVRVVFHIIERTIKADGQVLLVPEIEVDTYFTSLPDHPWQIVELYHDHGTSEQFHSEFKTDLDLERLPSGKFQTNNLILHVGLAAYNLLRLIGQVSLKVHNAPLRKKVKRWRIRTVIQNIMTIASKLVRHSRRYYLKFGCQSAWFRTFERVYCALSG